MVAEHRETGGPPHRRSVPRIKSGKLPKEMREFQLDFAEGGSYRGETIDASLTGISFRVEVPANRVRDYLVRLTSATGKIAMTQEIVYIKPIDYTFSRISLMFDEESTPQLYRRMVRQAFRNS